MMRSIALLLMLISSPLALAQQTSMLKLGPREFDDFLSVVIQHPGQVGLSGWRTGQWAEYRIKVNLLASLGGALSQRRKFAVVSKESRNGLIHYWIESLEALDDEVRVKKLLVKFGKPLEEAAREILLKESDGTIKRVAIVKPSPARLRRLREHLGQTWQYIGEEPVETPAGKFDSKHYRRRDAELGNLELWVSEKIVPLGLVQATSPKFTLELQKFSHQGAQSLIHWP